MKFFGVIFAICVFQGKYLKLKDFIWNISHVPRFLPRPSWKNTRVKFSTLIHQFFLIYSKACSSQPVDNTTTTDNNADQSVPEKSPSHVNISFLLSDSDQLERW